MVKKRTGTPKSASSTRRASSSRAAARNRPRQEPAGEEDEPTTSGHQEQPQEADAAAAAAEEVGAKGAGTAGATDTSVVSRTNKRLKQDSTLSSPSQSNDIVRSSSTTSALAASVSKLYDECFDVAADSPEKRRIATSKHAASGAALAQVVWPAILQYEEQHPDVVKDGNNSKKEAEDGTPSDVSLNTFRQAGPLLALLVSASHTMGQSPAQVLSFMMDEPGTGPSNNLDATSTSTETTEVKPVDDTSSNNTRQKLTEVQWVDCLNDMCQSFHAASISSQSTSEDGDRALLRWEYLGSLVHCLSLLVAEASTSSLGIPRQTSLASDAKSITVRDPKDVIWSGWLRVVLGVATSHEGPDGATNPEDVSKALWCHLPSSQREFLFRSHGFTTTESTSGHGNHTLAAPHPPFLVVVIRQLLDLLASDELKLGQVRFPATEDGDRHASNNDEDEEEELESRLKLDIKVAQWVFVHRALELVLDLLSHPFIRPALAPYLTALHFAVHCRREVGTPSPTSFERADPNWYLSQQLVARVDRSLRCVHESPDAMQELYHSRAVTLQRMCHRFYANELPDLIYAGAGTVSQDAQFLRSCVSSLEDAQLVELLVRMRLLSSVDNRAHDREFLLAVLEDYVLLPLNDPSQQLRASPLYPTESFLWDFSRIPPALSTLLPPSQVLSLPKLQYRFLNFAEYLSTNFELTQASSAYDIRVDLVDVIRRVRPLLRQRQDDNDYDNSKVIVRTEFTGWARMALELVKLEVVRVQKPQWGERNPVRVTADITVDLQPCGDAIRREWDELGEYDNLFLVAIDASKQSGQPAPLLRNYHLRQGGKPFDTDKERRIPDEDDRTFPHRFGVTLVRGCMIVQVRDEENNILNEPGSKVTPVGTRRIFRVTLDPSQYANDLQSPGGIEMYQSINLVVRRQGRENNFKSVLETMRGLMVGAGSIQQVLPAWLQPVILGHDDPSRAHYKSPRMQQFARSTIGVASPDEQLDFGDTFVDEDHLRYCFNDCQVVVDGKMESTPDAGPRRNYRLRILERGGTTRVEAASYDFRESVHGNPIKFTPVQVQAIRAGLSPGLTLVVGPPGTGKTDVAVQIVSCLYHSFPSQRTIVITHSNAALNDIFQKVLYRGDVDERYLVRLGSGERELNTDSTHDFTKAGRVAYSLHRRGQLLEQVQLLSESLGVSTAADRAADGSSSYTCETAEYFYRNHVMKQVRLFRKSAKTYQTTQSSHGGEMEEFPFLKFFNAAPADLSLETAAELVDQVHALFRELEEYRPLELLRSQRQRSDYLIMKQARVVAMTCTHAAMVREQLIDLGFHYDNVVVEEAGQMTEIENFVPLLLQGGGGAVVSSSDGGSVRLKRVCLLGDHNQLPPVIRNMTFAHYCNLDQSMFARLIRLGVPIVQLDKQGRARPEIANLYNWRYKALGNLEVVETGNEFTKANAGFVHSCQLINVDMYQGKGEQTPTAYFYQNLGEAEYAVALFQFMVLIGYPPNKISILTTYNGQRALIHDVLAERCGEGTPLYGVRPRSISTVDQYQGQQNDYIILSLVRTESVGHVRDIRRLVVAVSRARLGLYILCHEKLFRSCHDLRMTFEQLASRPSKLQLLLDENYPAERHVSDPISAENIHVIEDVSHLGNLVFQMQQQIGVSVS